MAIQRAEVEHALVVPEQAVEPDADENRRQRRNNRCASDEMTAQQPVDRARID
jgi:hypothetical protein